MPDTFFMNVDYPAWTMQLACSVASGAGAPLVIDGSQATLFIGQNSENLVNTQMEVVPDAEYRDEFVKKAGGDTPLKIEVQPVARALTLTWTTSSSASVRVRSQTCQQSSDTRRWRAIGMGVQAYRQHEVLFFDRRREKVSNKPIGT